MTAAGKRGEEYGGGFSCRGDCDRVLGPECALEQDEEHGRGICLECGPREFARYLVSGPPAALAPLDAFADWRSKEGDVALECARCHRVMAGSAAYDGACPCGGLVSGAKPS